MTDPRGVVGLLPVRRLDDAKGRLGPAVPPEQRARLALALLARAAAALFKAGLPHVAVITADERLANCLPHPRLEPLRQQSSGLNPAIREGQRWALDLGATALLVVLPDLPLVTAEDIRAVLDALEASPGAVIAPDRHLTGTNALLLAPPDAIDPGFGEQSAPRHRERLRVAGIPLRTVRRDGLSLDLDTPDDLDRLAVLGYDWTTYPER